MRADRLVATVLLLQTRGRVTAAELAAETEVSVATARRDLEALSSAGVPVYPQPGRGGGWQLVGGARTDLTGLTSGEAQALFLLLGAATAGGGARPETATAVRKLLRALPATFRADAEQAAAAVHVDPAGWGASAPAALEVLRTLQEAVVRRRVLEVDYASRSGEAGTRTVEPLGLVDKRGTWYLVAATAPGPAHLPGRPRAVGPADRRGVRAAGATSTWPPSGAPRAAEVDGHRSAVRATVRVPARLLPVLRTHFGTYLDERRPRRRPPVRRGPRRCGVGAHLVRGLAEQLAGFGAAVEVLDHPGVRAELAAIGAELRARPHGP